MIDFAEDLASIMAGGDLAIVADYRRHDAAETVQITLMRSKNVAELHGAFTSSAWGETRVVLIERREAAEKIGRAPQRGDALTLEGEALVVKALEAAAMDVAWRVELEAPA